MSRKYTRKEYERYLSFFPSADGKVLLEHALSFGEWKEVQPEADEMLGVFNRVLEGGE